MYIFDAKGSFVGYCAGGEGAVCEGGELAGDVDCVGGMDRLGVGAGDWRRGFVNWVLGNNLCQVGNWERTGASLFGVDGLDVCHFEGSRGKVDASPEVLYLATGSNDWRRSGCCGSKLRGQCSPMYGWHK